MIYFISDTHFGHKGSLFWGDGKNRQFPDVDTMNNTIISNWNSVVTDDDTVYHLGDVAYKASNTLLTYVFKVLKGKIILIKGNHDGRTLKLNQRTGRFESVHDRIYLEYNDKLFVLDHYPIYSWHSKNRGSIHLHGHVHGTKLPIDGNIMDVSCEAINYTPVSIDRVLELFSDKNANDSSGE